eukprot:scaffold8674_cov85-Cylindrotheca_fusiformis.AAC.2
MESKPHDDAVKTGGCIRFEDPQACSSQLLLDRVIHSSASKQNPYHEVEVRFKKVYDAELFKINVAGLFVNHDIDHFGPSL